MRQIHIHLLPKLTTPEELAGGTVVVIDVLRATSTIVTALANGAAAVIPCLEVDEARRIAAGQQPEAALLGGERGGLLIEGFHLANSPQEYSSDRVAGRTIVFTTTNGTRAVQQCRLAGRVLFGAFVNLSALCDDLRKDDAPLHLLCAGTQDRITREDALLAGAVAARLLDDDADLTLNDEASLISAAWRDFEQSCLGGRADAAALADTLCHSRGGRNAMATGNQTDIVAAARIDASPVVPELDAASGRIVLR
ncbi:MAG: 2-phosphosulfolactate phosphatase [Planctomycetes bacterium]|nr:2-phosphosulfolactate phosphatase [Planctomycetota bacterium]